jgi:hypothetical protein
MKTDHLRYDEVLVNFQSAPVVPAPYAYFYTMRLSPAEPEGIRVDFDMKYIDREELDEDEIIGEGFTLDDDFSWQGTLPAVWVPQLNALLTDSQYLEEAEENELEEFIEVQRTRQGQSDKGSPVDKETWSYSQQELMQAIFEAAGREKAFEMEYLRRENGQETTMELNASFVRKNFTLSLNRQSPRQLPWEQLEEVMATVFKADFLAEMASETRPAQAGTFLSVGDGLWYELGEAVVNPAPRSKVLHQIESLFKKLER